MRRVGRCASSPVPSWARAAATGGQEVSDCMDQTWACMTCSTTFRFGKLKLRGCDEKHPDGLACPHCADGLGLHPAGGETVVLSEYYGEIGVKN